MAATAPRCPGSVLCRTEDRRSGWQVAGQAGAPLVNPCSLRNGSCIGFVPCKERGSHKGCVMIWGFRNDIVSIPSVTSALHPTQHCHHDVLSPGREGAWTEVASCWLLGHWEETRALIFQENMSVFLYGLRSKLRSSESCVLNTRSWEADISPLSCLIDVSGRSV